MYGAQRQSLSEEAVSRLIDPRTGERLRPLGVVGGRVVWPIMGAAPDDPSGKEGSDGDNEDPEGNGSESGGDGGDDGENEGDKPKVDPDKNIDAKLQDLEEEKERHFRRRKETEAENETLRKRLKELEDKDKGDDEKLSEELASLKSENSTLMESLRERTLEVAFLKDNEYEWHSPGRALALADLSKVEIDEDGTVHGLKDALKALAKSDPYLVKGEQEKKEKEENPPSTDTKNPSKRERKGKSEEERRQELARKYPALRR
jgi:hypothetical protein